MNERDPRNDAPLSFSSEPIDFPYLALWIILRVVHLVLALLFF